MNENAILFSLRNILIGRFSADPSLFAENYEKHKLLGPRFRMDSITLLYFFFEVEKEFGIRIPEEDICAGGFSTLEEIAEIVDSCLAAGRNGNQAVS